MKKMELTQTQNMVLGLLARSNGCVQIAGYGRVHHVAAANSLVLLGLATRILTGVYAITDKGREYITQTKEA